MDEKTKGIEDRHLSTTLEATEAIKIIKHLEALGEGVHSTIFHGRTFTRHTNKNGDVGGFVESTANVSRGAYIGKDALVFDNAKVFDNARILNRVRIFGKTYVYPRAHVEEDEWISGNSAVYEEARVIENLGWIMDLMRRN